jgi:hypothetical protein
MKRILTIQYASNLFVHKNDSWKQAQSKLKVGVANHLALLGNIGYPHNPKTKDFLRWCSDNWKAVYCVPGAVELQKKDNLAGLYTLPSNVHLLDQTEIELPEGFHLIGAPMWSAWANAIAEISQWNETEHYFMANKSPHQIQYWHEEDIEFLVDRLRYHSASFGSLRKLIVMTHHLPSSLFLRNNYCKRDLCLYDANLSHLFTKNTVGCLSGAGGNSMTGFVGPHKTFCAVNAAFLGPDMVPNPMYRADMTASFSTSQPPHFEYKPSFVKWSDYLPKPELGIVTHNANPILF